jgi:hypothetical protein
MLVSNTMVIYHGILTLEKVGTGVNYHDIFITLAKNDFLSLEKGGIMVNYRGNFITLAPGHLILWVLA